MFIIIRAGNAIDYYGKFIKYFEDPKFPGNQQKAKVEEENVPAFLRAYMNMARLYGKLEYPDRKLLVESMKKSYECYKFVLQFAEEHNVTKMVEQEVDVCKQMVELLPMRFSA